MPASLEECNQIVKLLGAEDSAEGRHELRAIDDSNGHLDRGQAIAHIGEVRPTVSPMAGDVVAKLATLLVEEDCALVDRATGGSNHIGRKRFGSEVG